MQDTMYLVSSATWIPVIHGGMAIYLGSLRARAFRRHIGCKLKIRMSNYLVFIISAVEE